VVLVNNRYTVCAIILNVTNVYDANSRTGLVTTVHTSTVTVTAKVQTCHTTMQSKTSLQACREQLRKKHRKTRRKVQSVKMQTQNNFLQLITIPILLTKQ